MSVSLVNIESLNCPIDGFKTETLRAIAVSLHPILHNEKGA
jgi:hypothetical protein